MIITKEWLKEHSACKAGCKRAVSILKDGMPLSEFVKKFTRADWLVWTLDKAGVLTYRQKVLLACMYARGVLHLIPEGEERPRLAIEAAEFRAKNPSDEWAAWAASDAAWAASAAASAASDATSAAWAASAAAWAASAATSAAWAAAHKSMVKNTLDRLDAWGVFDSKEDAR